MRKLLCAVIAAAFVCAPACAKSAKGSFEGGVYFPSLSAPVFGDWAALSSPSLGMTVFGDYHVAEAVTVGAETGFDFGYPIAFLDGEHTTMFHFTPQVKYFGRTVLFNRPGRYYGVFGMGLYRASVLDDSSADFGINLGAGADAEIGKDMRAGVELRWRHVFADVSANDLDIMPKISLAF
ncbi:MAG: outer membrane beta-barrel protein [Elusimicrobiales bacterium]